MEKKPYTVGLIVKFHKTTRKADEEPTFKVVMKSKDKKITLNLELPGMGRQIFQLYPLAEIVELSLQEPSQITLDASEGSQRRRSEAEAGC